MTTEEQRLSEWLHEQTPDPPRAISLNQIATRVAAPSTTAPPRRPGHTGRWVTVLAAAAVVALVAALLATLQGRDHDPSPATPSPSPSQNDPTPSATPTTARPSARPTSLTFRPWRAKELALGMYLRLTSAGTSLYALADGNSTERIVRIDPVSGHVVATSPSLADTVSSSPLVVAGGRVWTAVQINPSHVALVGFDLGTLVLRERSIFAAVIPANSPGPALAASSDASTLYLGAGRNVYVVEAATVAQRAHLHVTYEANSLSASPDGATLYVASTSADELHHSLVGFDLNTRAVIYRGPATNNLGVLQATDTGYFATSYGGMHDSVYFLDVRTGIGVTEANGGGGPDAETSIAGGIAWVGGPQQLVCADPNTGRPRAPVVQLNYRAVLTRFAVVGHRLFARNGGLSIVELSPPKACGLR